MNIHHVLFFCFLSALCGGNTGLVSAKVYIFTGAEGGNGSVHCYFSPSGSRKFFCKDECKTEDILIETDDDRAQSGRYSIEYTNESSGGGTLSVTITRLTKSDAGRYRCGLGRALVPDSYWDLEVRVSDEALLDGNSGFIRTDTEGENITLGCSDTVYGRWKFFCKDECKKEEDILIETDENKAQSGRYSIEYIEGAIVGLHVTITQVTKSDTGRYRCGYGRALSPDSYNTFPIIVIDALSYDPRPGYFLPLVVCVPLVFVLLAVFLLVLYKWKTRRSVGLNTRGNADSIHMEACVTYENCAPVSKCDDSIYQNLHPDMMDQDQTYTELTKSPNK